MNRREIETVAGDIGVAHDHVGVHLLIRGRIVATVTEDEAVEVAKVLPRHADAVRKLRAGGES